MCFLTDDLATFIDIGIGGYINIKFNKEKKKPIGQLQVNFTERDLYVTEK